MNKDALRARAEEIVRTRTEDYWVEAVTTGKDPLLRLIEEALIQTREEALREAAEICTDSVIRHHAHGSASAWDECTKDPFQLGREILSLIDGKEIKDLSVELKDALKKYGQHTQDCQASVSMLRDDRCICGFSDVYALIEPPTRTVYK